MAKISLKQLGLDIIEGMEIVSTVNQTEIHDFSQIIDIDADVVFLQNRENLTTLQKKTVKYIHIIDDNKNLIGLAEVNDYDEINNIFEIQAYKYGVGGGSGADAELAEDVTSNVEVGAAPSNTLFPKGLSFTDFAKKLLIKEIAPTISFNATNVGTKEIGTVVSTTTLTLNITALNTGTPTAIKFYIDSILLDTQDYVPGTNSYSFVYSNGVSGSATVKGVLEYNKSTGAAAKVEGSKSFTFVYASYYGVTSLNVDGVTDAEVKAKTKTLLTSKGYTQNNISLNNQRIIYAYPKSYGNLSTIKDGNNFDVTASFTRREIDIDFITYNVYILNDTTTDSGIKMIYS